MLGAVYFDGDSGFDVGYFHGSSQEEPEAIDLELVSSFADALDTKRRVCLILKYVWDFKNVEISHVLGVTEARVSQLLSTSRDKIKENDESKKSAIVPYKESEPQMLNVNSYNQKSAIVPEEAPQFPLNQILIDVESFYISLALKKTSNNKARAAKILGLNRTTLVEKINKRSAVVLSDFEACKKKVETAMEVLECKEVMASSEVEEVSA